MAVLNDCVCQHVGYCDGSCQHPEPLAARLSAAYEKVAAWPENRMTPNAVEELGEGFTDLLKLRNLVPDVLAYLSSTSAGVTEEQREHILETVVAPDNGTVPEVLAAVLQCARAWVPEARIVGNVRAGDIARAIEAALEASRAAPVSQKEAGSVPSALDRIMADDRLRRARSKLSFDEIKKIIDHTKAAIREGGSNA